MGHKLAELRIPIVKGLAGRRCVVTGGAGFIGSTLTRLLLKSGAEVIVYDNLATGGLSNLECRDEVGSTPEVRWGDVRDGERLSRVLREGDTVFHLACLGVRHSIHSPSENEDVNARGALTVLSAARHAKARRLVHVSSSEVYGTARLVPMREDHPTEPHTVYGASKLAGECYARAFHRCYGFPAVVVRPFNAYGPRSHFEGDSGEVLPRFILRALTGRPLVVFGDGTQTRDLTHVYDSAAAIALAAVAKGIEGRTFNVGSGRELRIRELAEIVRENVGCPDLTIEHIEPRPGDVLRLLADSSEAASALGFRPAVSHADGVADLVARFRAMSAATLEEYASRIVVKNWE
jgi:UDP-glucose 4-epimerase